MSHVDSHSSGHSHDHSFVNTPFKALAIASTVTGVIFFAELIGGLVSGSLALLSDAMHMLSDAAGLIIALLAAFIGNRAASSRATYGYRRVEVLAALFNAIAVTLVVIFIVVQAIRRVGSDYEIDTNMMLVVAVIGLIANAISAWVLSSQQDNSLNVKGAFLHVMADLLGSVAVIIAGLVIRFTGFTFADTIASLLIVAFVLPRALGLLWTTIEVLLERVPRDLDLHQIEEALEALPQVMMVHDLHVWTTDGVDVLATAHLVVAEHDYRILDQAQEALREFGIEHSTIQLEHPDHIHHEDFCD
ncbi:cation diffusion facilitator family transporter [Corynebacterium ammoniagenes]|uniref:Cobalt transporter n=2 Tax=Corynebacterium ammoniagenes TaxID=1697 RepID=A0AAV5G4Z3_CORAM|nr:cation diffusion facilitator family transporter [Corynebacterium ammoniagenes]AQS73349.1 cation transporter [Corynebacterium ammoniagenes]EFG80159.1 cation diffusion facilitator family transporter [Corynebacterium ammoniagenes DSM 20306]NMF31141.1 cation transporter [Corynebacterium ammoniagenes]GJN42081.1 cobalt transporter [Corynebacterium ammoniagenes]